MKAARIGGAVGLLLFFALGIVLALKANGYWVFVIAAVALTAIAGVGLNVLIGLAGQISFGHVGFYAIGAYTVAILTTQAGLTPWIAMPLAALAAGASGFVLAIPALRVRGPYLAMVTIAFGFIVENVLVEWRGVTGGQNGIMGVPTLSLAGTASGERGVAVIAILVAAAALLGYWLLARGTWGHAIRAVRDSEVAAESVGIDPVVVKTAAFTLSAAMAGLAGGLFAPLAGFVTPSTFGFPQSILFVLVVLIGGAGSLLGPIVGALVVVLLPEMLSGLAEYRLLFFGALLLVVLWVAPRGIVGGVEAAIARWRRKGGMPAQALPAEMQWSARERRPLSARGLAIRFGGVNALSAFDLDVKGGTVHALIGPNGAGKTTALNLLSGFYVPQQGSMRLGGDDLRAGSAWRIARAGVARTYQTSQLFGSLDVAANLALACTRGRLGSPLGAGTLVSGARRSRALLAFVGYAGDERAPAASLAHVDRRLVEIARALATDPDVILLDEPAAGLSREDKERLSVLLRRIAALGVGVVLVEHDMALVMGCSDEITVLESGTRIAQGVPAAIQSDANVRRAYLGEPLKESERPARDRTPPGAELLAVGALIAGYGSGPVLRGVDLRLRDGEMIAVLGANGAGKSTLMRALAGLHRPVQGGIALAGYETNRMPAHRLVGRGLVLVPEGRQVFPELTVLENLRLGAFLQPAPDAATLDAMLHRFPRLRDRVEQRAGLLSGGEQQMLAIARALMSRPRVLLLDEPSLGLAPRVIAELFVALERLRAERTTLLLVDQMAGLALSLADRAYVMEDGRIVASGTADAIASDAALARAYLGAAV
jgi:branched-chain amino acid transport system ATP-binding protein